MVCNGKSHKHGFGFGGTPILEHLHMCPHWGVLMVSVKVRFGFTFWSVGLNVPACAKVSLWAVHVHFDWMRRLAQTWVRLGSYLKFYFDRRAMSVRSSRRSFLDYLISRHCVASCDKTSSCCCSSVHVKPWPVIVPVAPVACIRLISYPHTVGVSCRGILFECLLWILRKTVDDVILVRKLYQVTHDVLVFLLQLLR